MIIIFFLNHLLCFFSMKSIAFLCLVASQRAEREQLQVWPTFQGNCVPLGAEVLSSHTGFAVLKSCAEIREPVGVKIKEGVPAEAAS